MSGIWTHDPSVLAGEDMFVYLYILTSELWLSLWNLYCDYHYRVTMHQYTAENVIPFKTRGNCNLCSAE
jgi:hypothetical protein